MPGSFGTFAVPAAWMTKRARMSSPRCVATIQRPSSALQRSSVTRVWKSDSSYRS